MRAHVDSEIDPTADIGRGILLEITRRSHTRLTIGERARIQPRVLLRLQGGELSVGPHSEIRVGAALNVKGTLELRGRNILGKGATVHADTHQIWEWGASVGEYASIIDSEHLVDGSPVHVWDQPVKTAPVSLGAACFVAAHAVVTAGTSIGRGAVVGANAVVTRDVAAGIVVAGVPARPIDRP
jgi:acetyltransferase-like isoleucine patch superfamily enzyme